MRSCVSMFFTVIVVLKVVPRNICTLGPQWQFASMYISYSYAFHWLYFFICGIISSLLRHFRLYVFAHFIVTYCLICRYLNVMICLKWFARLNFTRVSDKNIWMKFLLTCQSRTTFTVIYSTRWHSGSVSRSCA